MSRIVLVTVDAAIAAGKSTLIDRLRSRLRWHVVVAEEPVAEWQASGLLADMYDALAAGPPSAEGMPGMFQVYAFSTRIARLAAAVRAAEQLSAERGELVVVLSERSVFTDRAVFKHMLADAGHITPAQDRVYEGCYAALVPATLARTAPDLCVWLDTDVATCLKRQRTRARNGETLDRPYAAALHKRHVELFGSGHASMGGCDVPVLRLDGRAPFHTDDAALSAMVVAIEQAIGQSI